MARQIDFTGAQCDLRVNEGTELRLPIQLTGGGSPIDKTGRTYQAEMKRNASDSAALLVFTLTPGAAGTDPMELSASFDSISPGIYYWDLWEDLSGSDRQLVAGKVIVERRVVVAP